MNGSKFPTASPAPAKKKAACSECRQQKMRCEARSSASDASPCSRCSRLKIPCVFSAPFKRTNKRKRLQELEEETTALKCQLLSVSPSATDSNARSRDAPASQKTNASAKALSPRITGHLKSAPGGDRTLPRTIGGLELASSIIDDCLRLYFERHHLILPFLDPTISPNMLYQHSPILFWVVISVGSQLYTRQPTLSGTMAMPVTQLVLQSTILRTNPAERMKALILLLTWPFPASPFYRDPSFVLSGALLHMAMHCGLHTSSLSQDLMRTISKHPETEIAQRVELWAYVMITYQRICSAAGLPSFALLEPSNDQTSFKNLLEKLPTTLEVQIQISNITSRAHKTLLDFGLMQMTTQDERTLDALLKGFNTELDGLERLSLSAWDRLYITCSRHDLMTINFYKSTATLDVQVCTLIFNAASKVLEQIGELDRRCELHLMCSRFLLTATLSGLASIARIVKGPFAAYLDQTSASSLFDAGVSFVRSCSIQKGDFADKCATSAERMWRSKKVFRDPDGTINISLRVRNRLSVGPWHDAITCWREEFFDPECVHYATKTYDTVMPPSSPASRDGSPAPGPSNGDEATYSISTMPQLLLEDELWGDLGLGMPDGWDLPMPSMTWTP